MTLEKLEARAQELASGRIDTIAKLHVIQGQELEVQLWIKHLKEIAAAETAQAALSAPPAIHVLKAKGESEQ